MVANQGRHGVRSAPWHESSQSFPGQKAAARHPSHAFEVCLDPRNTDHTLEAGARMEATGPAQSPPLLRTERWDSRPCPVVPRVEIPALPGPR